MTKLSIVIPCWIMNKQLEGFLKNCIESIVKYTTVDYELVLVDNGSDFAIDYMKQIGNTYIRNEKNLGFAPAVNQGYKAAKGEFVCIMNDDIVVGENWDTNLLEEAEKGFIAMPALMQEWPEMAQKWPETDEDLENLWEAIRHEQTEGDRIKDLIERNQVVKTFDPLDGFGALYVVKKEIFDQVVIDGNLFDEGFVMGMGEDRDLWARLYLKGFSKVRNHRVRVFHIGNASWGKLPDRSEIFKKNHEYLEQKLRMYGIIK